MEYAKIGLLSLYAFNKENKDDIDFIKRLIHDETITKRFQGIGVGLLNDRGNEFFNRSFLVKYNANYIGYINIGAFNEEEKTVYLRAAIDKSQRGNAFGKTLLSEITEYIFKNYPQIENISLKIASDNKASLMTANACGYVWLRDDFYIKENPYINKRTR